MDSQWRPDRSRDHYCHCGALCTLLWRYVLCLYISSMLYACVYVCLRACMPVCLYAACLVNNRHYAEEDDVVPLQIHEQFDSG